MKFSKHIMKVKEKSFQFNQKLIRISRPTWGVKGPVVKRLYLTAVEKMILYGSEIWYSGTVKQDIRLLQIQRSCLLRITKCYKTVSNEALCTIAGVQPIHITASMQKTLYRSRRQDKEIKFRDLTIRSGEIEKFQFHYNPELLVSIEYDTDLPSRKGVEIYTDGSKLQLDTEHRVGAAFTVHKDGNMVEFSLKRLNNKASVFEAELSALYGALNWCKLNTYSDESINIYSDSLSSLLALKSIHTSHPFVEEIKQLYTKIKSKGIGVSLHWIPAHTGFEGNEDADQLAKEAASLEFISIYTRLSWPVVRAQLQKRATAQWQVECVE
jgi:ribonuclease HI